MMWHEHPGVVERYEAKIQRSATCWLWRGGKAGAGYGIFRLSRPVRRQAYAHRLAMERKIGRDLFGKEYVLHSCDTPACVNPDHLRLGDQFDNMADSLARGRFAIGEAKIRTARLTEIQVREIMALGSVPGLTQREISDRYGVSRPQVTNIINGKTWRHITAPRAN